MEEANRAPDSSTKYNFSKNDASGYYFIRKTENRSATHLAFFRRLGESDSTDSEISCTDRRLIKVDCIFRTYLNPWHEFHLNLTNE